MEELGAIIPKAIHKHVSPGRKPVLEILVPLWSRAAGRFIGQSSRPAAFDQGCLTLDVWSPSWETQLRALAAPLRACINDFLGYPAVSRLVIRLRIQGEPPVDKAFGRDEAAGKERALRSDPSLAAILRAKGGSDLPEELAEVVERSFVKYFSRGAAGN